MADGARLPAAREVRASYVLAIRRALERVHDPEVRQCADDALLDLKLAADQLEVELRFAASDKRILERANQQLEDENDRLREERTR